LYYQYFGIDVEKFLDGPLNILLNQLENKTMVAAAANVKGK
jgi:hypothetical protein